MTHLEVRAYWLFLPPVAPSRLWLHWSKCSQIYARCLSARSTSFQVQGSRQWLIEASVSSNWSVMTLVTYAKFDGVSAWPVQSGAECSGKLYRANRLSPKRLFPSPLSLTTAYSQKTLRQPKPIPSMFFYKVSKGFLNTPLRPCIQKTAILIPASPIH